METNSLGFIGGGRITRIFLQGISEKNALPESIKVYEPNTETAQALQADFPKIEITGSAADAATQNFVFIAVHPPVVMESLQAIKDVVSESTTVISLAPKITLEKMASLLPTKKLARMIPNATSYINAGFNPITFSEGFNEKEKKQVLKILKKLGKTFETDEPKLESYAIISAMLPTYFWFQWQELEKIGQDIGLTPNESSKAIRSTLKKAIKIYFDSGLQPEVTIDLIPVKPIGEKETEINEIYQSQLKGLFNKIKP